MIAAAPPTLAVDLVDGLRRLKLATMREQAPEVLQTAVTQRWGPEEVLRSLLQAEIAARDAAKPTHSSQARRVSSGQDPGGLQGG